MEGPKKMMYDKSGPKLVQALEKRNMEGYYCSTVEEAVAKVLELIPQEHTVSWGGVMTADQLGVKQALARRGFSWDCIGSAVDHVMNCED